MADDAEGGRPPPGEPSSPTPATVPEVEVFGDVTALADSLLHPAQGGLVEPEVITDEERNRYGSLLDRAAERGLLEPAEYQVRLQELAEATSTQEMMRIVTELPVFDPLTQGPAPKKTRPARHTMSRGATQPGSRRRATIWALLGLLVVVAVVSLVILAVSAERLTHRQGGGSGTGHVPSQVLSGLRL